jgi:hypothetical protein
MGWEPDLTTTATVELFQYNSALLLLCGLGVATSYELGWGGGNKFPSQSGEAPQDYSTRCPYVFGQCMINLQRELLFLVYTAHLPGDFLRSMRSQRTRKLSSFFRLVGSTLNLDGVLIFMCEKI